MLRDVSVAVFGYKAVVHWIMGVLTWPAVLKAFIKYSKAKSFFPNNLSLCRHR